MTDVQIKTQGPRDRGANAGPGTTIDVNVPPVNFNPSSGSNAAPVPTAGASTGPAKPAGGTGG